MAVVAGVDFGTQSVRVSLVDSERGRLASAAEEYPLERRRDDPDHATQRHADHMTALAAAMRRALGEAGLAGSDVLGIACDTTASSVIPLGEGLQPLDDYYLWCDHRAHREAAEITAVAREQGLEALDWCGGAYSSEWGFAKLLHWLRHNPGKRDLLVTAAEHADYAAAVLCGVTDPAEMVRGVCAMGHKWMWNRSLGGLPPEEFLVAVDPLLAGVRAKLDGRYLTSDQPAGRLSAEWAEKLGLEAGIPVAVGGVDAHWDAVGAGVNVGDVVNVIGTSTCLMAVLPEAALIPGVSGIAEGSIHPAHYGLEAGLSATGDLFDSIARRAGIAVGELAGRIEDYRAAQTGLLRLAWDNGDRTVLVNPELGGVTLGWNLAHRPEDELFAAIESTALHTRIILDRVREHGVPVERLINGGGIPQRGAVLNRVYANALGLPVLVPDGDVTSLGAAAFAFVAARVFPSIDEAQRRLAPSYRVIEPDPAEKARYDALYALFQPLYFGLGQPGSEPVALGGVLPELRRLAGR